MGLTLYRRRQGESDAPKRSRRRRPHLIGEVLIVIILVKVYDYVRSFAADRTDPARKHGRTVLEIERSLHINVEESLNHWLAGIHWLTLVTAYWYQFFHIGVTLIVLAWCYISRPILYRAARNALVITNLVGLAVFVVLPVMPPRMLPGAGFTDSVAAAGFGSPEGGPVQADQYAAMPSLHLAWATWTLLLLLALLSGRRWRWLCIAYPCGTAFVVMSTGNHYLLDVMAGIAVTLVAAWLTGMRRAAIASEDDHSDKSEPGVYTAALLSRWNQLTHRRSGNAPSSSGGQAVIDRHSSPAPSTSPEAEPATASAATGAASESPAEDSRADSMDTTR